MLDASLEPSHSGPRLPSLAGLAALVLALLLLQAAPVEAAPAEDEAAAEKSEPTKPAAAKPIAEKPLDLKVGEVNPEEVDWQTVPPGEKPPPPKREIAEIPWSAKLSGGAGIDSNIDLFPTGSDTTVLAGLGFYAQALVGRNIRLATLGNFEKNPTEGAPAATESEFFAGYMRELPNNMQLRVSNMLAYARERSVFADGTVLLSATTLQTILFDNLAVIGAWRRGPFDLEFGTQGSVEVHAGKIEESRLLGVDAIAGLRYTFRDRVSLRLRYSYEFSSTTGLSARNLAGGVDATNVPLRLGIHRVRSAARVRLARNAQVVARFDRVYATDDFSGFLNSHESVAFLGGVAQTKYWTFEGDLQWAKRFFTDRIPTIDNPNSDTVLSGTGRLDLWAFMSRRLGLFAMYRLEKATAHPTGTLFVRHVALSGIVGRFGSKN